MTTTKWNWHMTGPAWVSVNGRARWIDGLTLRPGTFTKIEAPYIWFKTDEGRKVRTRLSHPKEANDHFISDCDPEQLTGRHLAWPDFVKGEYKTGGRTRLVDGLTLRPGVFTKVEEPHIWFEGDNGEAFHLEVFDPYMTSRWFRSEPGGEAAA